MSTPSAYQKVVTQYDVTEAGVASIFYSVWDNTDDILPITLPAITGGTVALVGLNGIWIEDDWDFTAGTLSIGPTTIAGLPAGILEVVGDLCAVIINDRAWTAAERAGVISWGKARGAPGVFSLGEELVPALDLTAWTTAGDATNVTANSFDVADIGGVYKNVFDIGEDYIVEASVSATAIGALTIYEGLSGTPFYVATATTFEVRQVVDAAATQLYFRFNAGATLIIDNISVRKLELLP